MFIQTYTQLPWPLETKRVRIRGLKKEEKAAVFEIVRHEAVAKWNPWSSPQSVDGFDFSWGQHQAYANKELAFIDKTTNTLIGTGGLYIDESNHKARLGYILHPALWNQGYMTEIIDQLLYTAFEQLKLHRVEATVYCGNTASARVLEKTGFQYEGRQRDVVYVKHKYISQDMYGLVYETWKNQHRVGERSQ